MIEGTTKRTWRDWWRFTERVVIFLGSLGLIVLMVLIVLSVFRGEPDHSEIVDYLDQLTDQRTEQHDRIELKLDFLSCILVSGPDRTPADIAKCQLEADPLGTE